MKILHLKLKMKLLLSFNQKLFGILFNYKFDFDEHVR